jgi:hypothetical protein
MSSHLEEAPACRPCSYRISAATIFQLGERSGWVTWTKPPQAEVGFCRCFCLSRFLLRHRRLPQASALRERICGSRKASSACAAPRSQPTHAPEIPSLPKRGSTPAVSATSSRRAVNSSYHSGNGRPLFPTVRFRSRAATRQASASLAASPRNDAIRLQEHRVARWHSRHQ